jgi:hypothetical protein
LDFLGRGCFRTKTPAFERWISLDSKNIIDFPRVLSGSIGSNAVIHTHNTFPSMSQKYHQPMWNLPGFTELEPPDRSTIAGNQGAYMATQGAYHTFAQDFLKRLERLNA